MNGGIRGRVESFGNALRGAAWVLRSEPNAWIHALATLCVVGLASWLGLPGRDWAVLVLCIGAVLGAESLNSALESLADHVSPERQPRIGQAKDAAAAGVLFVALAAAVVGFLVLGPPLLARLG